MFLKHHLGTIASLVSAAALTVGCSSSVLDQVNVETAITGQVIDAVTYLPIEKAVVKIVSAGDRIETKTDADGFFYLTTAALGTNAGLEITAEEVLDPTALAADEDSETTTTYSKFYQTVGNTYVTTSDAISPLRQRDYSGANALAMVKPVGTINVYAYAAGLPAEGVTVFVRNTSAAAGGLYYAEAETDADGAATFISLPATAGWVVANSPTDTYFSTTAINGPFDISQNVAKKFGDFPVENATLILEMAGTDFQLMYANFFNVSYTIVGDLNLDGDYADAGETLPTGYSTPILPPTTTFQLYFNKTPSDVSLDCTDATGVVPLGNTIPVDVVITNTVAVGTPRESLIAGHQYTCIVTARTAAGETLVSDGTGNAYALTYTFAITNSPDAPGAITVAFNAAKTDEKNADPGLSTFNDYVDTVGLGTLNFNACYDVTVASLTNLTHLSVHLRNNDVTNPQGQFDMVTSRSVDWYVLPAGDADADVTDVIEPVLASDLLDLRNQPGTAQTGTTLTFCVNAYSATPTDDYTTTVLSNEATSELGVLVVGYNSEYGTADEANNQSNAFTYTDVASGIYPTTYSNIDKETYTRVIE